MNFSLEIWKRSFQGFGGLAADAPRVEQGEDEQEEEDPEDEARCSRLEKKVRILETRLTYKEAQLLSIQEKVAALQSRLEEKEKCVDGLRKSVLELEQQKVVWVRKEEVLVAEMQELVSVLEDKCVALTTAGDEAEVQSERCRGMQEKVDSLEQRGRDADEALRCREAEVLRLRENNGKLVSELEGKVAATAELRRDVEAGNMKLESANLKIQELESMLGKVAAFAQEKDDKLDASEWAVRQLGVYEVSRAKASLAQAEKDHAELQQEFSDLETKLKVKEEELVDVESYMTRQLRKAESEAAALKEKLELQSAKYERLESEHGAVLCRVDEYERQLQSEQEMNLKLTSSVVVFQQDVTMANDKLKEVNLELERSQMDNRGLIEQMLLLHQNLLEHEEDDHNNVLVLNGGGMIQQQSEVELKCGKRCRISDAHLNQTLEGGKNSLVLLPPKRQRQCEEIIM